MFLIFGTLRLFMMATNLFVIANVKQLRTDGSFRILLPFFLTSWGVGVLNSAMFNRFHNRFEFGTILEGHRNFGGTDLKPPLGTPLVTPPCTWGVLRPALVAVMSWRESWNVLPTAVAFVPWLRAEAVECYAHPSRRDSRENTRHAARSLSSPLAGEISGASNSTALLYNYGEKFSENAVDMPQDRAWNTQQRRACCRRLITDRKYVC